MFRSYFTIAIRNLYKNRTYAIINVMGLALGIACCLVIFVIIRYETSFDDYHKNADRIYRVNLCQKLSDGFYFDGNNYSPLAEAMRHEVEGLDAVTGVYCLRYFQFSKEEKAYRGEYAFFADKDYFKVFDVTWLAGSTKDALTDANTVIVTDAFAEKWFGGIDKALGSVFQLERKMSLTIVGIVKAPPGNTDHPYSMLISYPTLATFIPETVDDWINVRDGATYALFREDSRVENINNQLNKIIKKYIPEETAANTAFHLLPLNDNHDRNYDYTSFTYDFPVPVMLILSIIAGIIAFIACFNFINLATAQSLKRAREVGIRKTMGSSRGQLIMQYWSEAFVITLMATIVGIAIAYVAMHQLNMRYGGTYLQFGFLSEPDALIFIALIVVLITSLSGFYPAFVLSGYRPVSALKSQQTSGGLSLRRSLVIIQFVGAQVLILVTFILVGQINHFRDRDIGYDAEAIVSIPYIPKYDTREYAQLHEAWSKIPGVTDLTFTYAPPMGGDEVGFHAIGAKDKIQTGLVNYVDTRFLETFDVGLMAGEGFSDDQQSGSLEVLVNEAMLEKLGAESAPAAIGMLFSVGNRDVKIRGVFENFYTQSLSIKADPMVLEYNPEKASGVCLKIDKTHVSQTIARMKIAWADVYPDVWFGYQFMNDFVESRYGFFNLIFSIMSIASGLAIFIGCLGLYGLISFMTVQRTKEIGIRKVMGATVTDIVMIFSKESLLLLIISFVIAAPVARLAAKGLLMELPEQISPGIMIFIVTLIGSLLVAGATIGFRSFHAALQNPVESLRSE